MNTQIAEDGRPAQRKGSVSFTETIERGTYSQTLAPRAERNGGTQIGTGTGTGTYQRSRYLSAFPVGTGVS